MNHLSKLIGCREPSRGREKIEDILCVMAFCVLVVAAAAAVVRDCTLAAAAAAAAAILQRERVRQIFPPEAPSARALVRCLLTAFLN